MDNELILSQFVNNSSNYLTSDTILSFSNGNYSLKSELVIKNVHSFSMFVWPPSSSKAVITCGHNARFEFRNVSIVTVSGLEFVGCFENRVLSVNRFQLENSGFFGNSQEIVNGSILSIDKTIANLDRVAFVSAVDVLHPDNSTLAADDLSLAIKRVNGILLKSSNIRITQSRFEGNVVQFGALIYVESGSHVTIVHTTFVNNSASSLSDCNITASIVYIIGNGNTVNMNSCKFVENVGVIIFGDDGSIPITQTSYRLANNECRGHFANLANIHSNKTWGVPDVHTKMNIMKSDFNGNTGFFIMYVLGGMITNVDYSEFINNTGTWLLYTTNASELSVTHSEFVNNSATDSLIDFDAIMITVYLSKFVNNGVGFAVIETLYFTTAESLAKNVFIDNSAAYDIYIIPFCRPGLSHSLGSSRCIQCSKNWRQDLMGIVVAAFVTGIALVIFILALNMTIAVGTFNGILFYANIVAAYSDTYFLPFTAPNFVTLFISWLNLEIGFDVCFFTNTEGTTFSDVAQPIVYKALLQLAFPVYVIFLVIIVIVAGECSSKFAKMIGKGNPVAVLATLILVSYTKLFNALLASASLLYLQPAHGSRNVDVIRFVNFNVLTQDVEQSNDSDFKATAYFLFVLSIFIFLLSIIFTALVFFWQWLLRYQDKAIFKWVRYQKLHHFLEPYHAPYTAKYRYWTGLLLFARALLYLISVLNFSLDPRVELMAVIFIVGGLILLKAVTTKRVYKNWPLDVMETAIYFSLVAFSALTWYNLDFGGNQVAVAYTSVMIIFILLLGVIVFHVLRYTRLYEYSFVEKTFNWTSSKLLEKKQIEQAPNNAPEELNGYRLERSAADDQQQPTVTFSVIELTQPAQNYTD